MTRIEKDVIGEVKIEDDIYYGINTLRAKNNFNISGIVEDEDHIKAMTIVKRSAAVANNKLQALPDDKKDYILKAADEILKGKFNDQFVIDVYQAGAGTSFNMNANEVMANVALETWGKKKGEYQYLHPNDHVNMSQSTNDVYPTMMRVSAMFKAQRYIDELKLLIKSAEKKADQFKNLKKPGRTHLQDAAPISLGIEFSAYAYSLKKSLKDFENSVEFILELNIGGTATGTGINTPKGYQREVVSEISKFTGFNFRPSDNMPGIMEFQSDFARMMNAIAVNALDINKMANDIRLMYSGPGAGIHEIFIPAVQQGSSIMPGKINPSIAEAMNMICHSTIGAQQALNLSVQAGQLELNVMMPNIDFELSRSLQIMTNGMKMFRTLLIEGIEANVEACNEHLSKSFGSAALLNPYLGYDTVAKVVREALDTHKTIKELALKTGKISEEQYIKVMTGTQ
jgi:fumarate hydratase class II/aspartate ammonia-lyase